MEKKVYVKPFMKEHELQHRTGLLNMASGKIGINQINQKDDNYFAGKAW